MMPTQSIGDAASALKARMRQRLADAPRLDPEEYERRRLANIARNAGSCAPDCEFCHGIGFLTAGPGRVDRCPNNPITRNVPLEKLGMTPKTIDWRWDRLRDVGGVGRAVAAVRAAITRGRGWVFVYGGVGLAKSIILKVAVAEALRANRSAVFTDMGRLIDALTNAVRSDGGRDESLVSLLDFYDQTWLLAIDEMERMGGTPFATLRRFQLLNNRYNRIEDGLPSVTLMASNQPPEFFDDPNDHALYDRLTDGRFEVIQLTGESARSGLEWNPADWLEE